MLKSQFGMLIIGYVGMDWSEMEVSQHLRQGQFDHRGSFNHTPLLL